MNLRQIFPAFDEPLVEHLMSVGEVVLIPAGELMLRPGQYFKSIILILKGTVKLFLEGEKGQEIFLYFLEPGSACALSIICSTHVSDVKAKAATDVTAMMVPYEQMDTLIKKHPKWNYFLLETYHYRFQELLSIVDQVAFHSMDEKLAYYLKQRFEVMKSSTISTTHQEIAADLNSSREVISRLLKKLETENRITISRNEITNISL